MKDYKRILIARTDRLGDVILSTPVIRHMRKLYPGAYISFMVRPENRDIVAANLDLDEIIVYDKYGKQRNIFSTVNFAFGLRSKKFDLAIALHPTNRVHLILFLAGIPERIGYDRKLGWLLTQKIKHEKQYGEKHEVDYNLGLLASAGFDISGADRQPYMNITTGDRRRMDAVLKDLGIKGNIAVIHPGASCPSKRWSPKCFARVADIVSGKYGMEVVLVGGDETSKYSAEAGSIMRKTCSDLTGALTLGELAALISRASIFISNDSGPVHMSVAVGTPAVVIFGRKDSGLSPVRWGPLGVYDKVIHKPAECVKCLAHNCEKDFKCLRAVSVEDVAKAVDEVLTRGT